MPSSAFSPDNIIIAWAARVSFAQLGARLTAYIETRASITTFRLTARYTSSTAFRNLPEELISMIANQAYDHSFYDNIHKWLCVEDCFAGKCTILSHFDRFCSRGDNEYCRMLGLEYDEDEGDDMHLTTVYDWTNELTKMDGSSKIAKCVRIFTREFGMRPYFILEKDDDQIEVKAYLILPLTQAPLQTFSDNDEHSFIVESVLDRKMLTGLEKDQRRKFRRASAVLRLHAYNAKENESKYYHDLRPCYCDIPSSHSEDDRSAEMDRAIGKKDLNSQIGAGGQDGKQKDNAVHTGVLSTRASSPSYRTMRKAKLKRKALRPRLMMLGSGNYFDF
ncbi:MAG: hypothetical protein L6R36_007064 [Xanthoria steineri]|nr:MAG: hypothetical protein L6R36_007064 [Xanthoria steineri]